MSSGAVQEVGVGNEYKGIHPPLHPFDNAGADSFSNQLLFVLLLGVPWLLTWEFGLGWVVYILLTLLLFFPILIVFWSFSSAMAPARAGMSPKAASRGVEHFVSFTDDANARAYHGTHKIPIADFYELYFAGKADFRGDALEVLESRHEWASFRFTYTVFAHFLLGFIPELLVHSRSQDEEQVRDHYDRGDDFYAAFLGPRMIYTSGIMQDPRRYETLEEMQDHKMDVVCDKMGLKTGQTMLDLGCGWGTLARYASQERGAQVTGITLGRNQTAWGNRVLSEAGQKQSRILCLDYRDAPLPEGVGRRYDKITCLEMAEHVGVRHFSSFLGRVNDMLEDDGTFFLQIAGLRKAWQYEDLIWGLFMNKYIFPGADASTPLGWTVDKLEGAGFEIKSIDTIGVHYSATLWRWYQNWLSNRGSIEGKYGRRWYRIWEFFLAYSTIISRQGSAACYQIVMHKNLNTFSRVAGIHTQFGLATKK